MSYEKSKLLSLLKKQDINSLFLEATNYLCQTKSLFEEKEQLQQENEHLQQENKQLKEIIKANTILVKDEYGDYQECNINPLEMKQKYEKQVDNWNKLKEYCKENTLCYEVGDDENTKLIGSKIHGLNVLDKMQELEQGSDK